MSDTVEAKPEPPKEQPKEETKQPSPPRKYLPRAFGQYLTHAEFGPTFPWIDGTFYMRDDNQGFDSEGRYQEKDGEFIEYDSISDLHSKTKWDAVARQKFIDIVTNIINRK